MTTPTIALGARSSGGSSLLTWLTTTDHKKIGILYGTSALGFFLAAGLLALIMRSELTLPELQFLSAETYNQLFTIHGTAMMLLFATPMVAAFANYLIPLQIGAADMAFPRLNALSFWLFLFGGLVIFSGFLVAAGPADVGWTGYAPNSTRPYSTTPGTDLWIVGLILTGVSSVLGSVNFIATIYTRRAPGMAMLRLSMFNWNILVTSILILFSFPAITTALVLLLLERRFGASFFDPAEGGNPILWQHLFWFFGHPEVYIVALPFFGAISEIIPVFSRKPLFGYRALVLATIFIGAYSMSVWAHHMFTTGAISLPFFSITSFIIAVPTGVKFFNWIGTMWHGKLTFPLPMMWAVGFLFTFLFGGITGVMVASPPLDFQFQDTYFVVAHLHNVLVGGSIYAMWGGIYFWFPKISGRRLSEFLGRIHFWLWTIGFIVTFLPQYQLGAEGMPRRYATYPADAGWTLLNIISTVGSMIIGLSVLFFLAAVVEALRRPPDQPNDPWGGNSLEWWATSPPPHHNFPSIPPIRSERPVFDARQAGLMAAGRPIPPNALPPAARARGDLPVPPPATPRDAHGALPREPRGRRRPPPGDAS